MIEIIQKFFAFTVLTLALSARGELSSNYDVNIGFGSIDAKTVVTSTTVTGLLFLDVNYNLFLATCKCTFSLTMQEFVSSSQGSLAFTRFGLGSRYYPFNANSYRVIIDNKAEARVWRAAPFIGLELGTSTLSVSKADSLGRFYNSFSNDVAFRLGNEIPIGAGVILLGHIIGAVSLGGGTGSGGSGTQASYTSFGVLVGLRITPND